MWPDNECQRIYAALDQLHAKSREHFLLTALRWIEAAYENELDCEKSKACQDVVNALAYAIEKAESYQREK